MNRIPLLCLLLWICSIINGCTDDTQSVQLVAQDFRFTPDIVHVEKGRPVHLSLFNEGREFHEFDGAFLSDPAVIIDSIALAGERRAPHRLRMAPGQRLELRFHIPAGVYVFHCNVRGHAGMTGTLIVE